jgi:hypothetical protein
MFTRSLTIFLAVLVLVGGFGLLAKAVRDNQTAIQREHGIAAKECRDLDNLKEVTLQALLAAEARARLSLPKGPTLTTQIQILEHEVHMLQHPTCR